VYHLGTGAKAAVRGASLEAAASSANCSRVNSAMLEYHEWG
jgi:hypothetical protein